MHFAGASSKGSFELYKIYNCPHVRFCYSTLEALAKYYSTLRKKLRIHKSMTRATFDC